MCTDPDSSTYIIPCELICIFKNGFKVLNACDWGYYLSNENKYIPIKTTLPPPPEKLLKVIHCKCKTNCDSKRFTCRKLGIECSVGCGECRGLSCSYSNITRDEEDEYAHY